MKNSSNNREAEEKGIITNISFYPETATMLLDIDEKAPSLETKRAEAEKLGLREKKDFHITVIGSDTGEEILESLSGLDEQAREDKLNEIYKLGKSMAWEVTLNDKYFYVQKDYIHPGEIDPEQTTSETRKSILQMADVKGMDEFYKKLNAMVEKKFDTPLPHITLYTTSTREDKRLRGIGIYSKKLFDELNPEKI